MASRSLHKWAGIALAIMGTALTHPSVEAQDNPAARRTTAGFILLSGFWNGAHLEQRSSCTNPQNNGFHGTYAEYNVTYDRATGMLGIIENTVTGLTCTYSGQSVDDWLRPRWTGAFDCSGERRGTFEAQSFLVTPNAMSIRLAIKLSLSETCNVDAILGGSRF